MKEFASIVADRSGSGPSCKWQVYRTTKPYDECPSKNDFTAWIEAGLFGSYPKAEEFCNENNLEFVVNW
jgi:hypothetical protein